MNATLEQALREAAAKAGTRWEGPLREALSRLCQELLRWNERVRLVGYRGEEPVYENLILEALCLLASDWLALGARLIGGCCGTRVSHARALVRLARDGH